MSNNCSCSLPDTDKFGNVYFKSDWDFCTEYEIGDVVLYQGGLYLAVTPHAGKEPKRYKDYWVCFGGMPPPPPGVHRPVISGGYASEVSPKYTTIRIRRDSAKNWEDSNPRLALGEFGVDMTALRIKIGNGIDKWNELDYIDESTRDDLDDLTLEVKDKIESILNKIADTEGKLDAVKTQEEQFESEIDSKFDTAKQALDDELAEIIETRDNINTRIDVIVGSVTEDSEILDARVDAENNVHPNLGHNIRSIHRELLNLPQELKEENQDFNNVERSIRVEQDDGLQNQINKISEALINISLEYQILRRRLFELGN